MMTPYLEELLLLEERERRRKYNALARYRPQAKQRDFHNAMEREVCLGAGNQLGKTFAAAHDVAIHMTGLYPDWWEGIRFERAPKMWVCGRTMEVVRDSIQLLILGDWKNWEENKGSGSIPRDRLTGSTFRRGLAGAIDSFTVKHMSGGTSSATFKSYDMGREKFQATTLDLIYFDEEPPADIYSEGKTRTNKGQHGNRTRLSFTPLLGMTVVVMGFYKNPKPHQRLVQFTIEEAEHYTEAEKAAIIAGYPEHEREARAKGVPILGSGRIYAVPEETIKESHIHEIPTHWARVRGLDFGFDHPSACVEIAWDREEDVMHVVRGVRVQGMDEMAMPVLMATRIKAWAPWVPVAWPHDGLQHDKGSGQQLAKQYREAGLEMLYERATHEEGGNGVEAGIAEINERMRTGRFKVDESLTEWWEEFRLYHRKDGKIQKTNDDLMDATRYAVMMRRFAEAESEQEDVLADDSFEVSEWG